MKISFAVVTASALLLSREVYAVPLNRASGALRASANQKLMGRKDSSSSGEYMSGKGGKKSVGKKSSGKKSVGKKSGKKGYAYSDDYSDDDLDDEPALVLTAEPTAAPTAAPTEPIKLSDKAMEELEASQELRDSMTVAGMFVHLDALQAIGTKNGGNRFTGTQGYEDSVTYATGVFEGAGYNVTIQEFIVAVYELNDFPEMSSATQGPFEQGVDFSDMTFSGTGTVTGPVAFALEVGCEIADFDDFPAESIAVISRGVCTFATKALNAQAAGAAGVVVYNDAARIELFGGTLGSDSANVVTIPVMSAPFSFSSNVTVGEILTLTVDASIFESISKNVLAELVSGDGPFVMAGAHLDSVEPGPGINDNGSGSSSILELAVNMAGMQLENNVRFALWGAEELGLLGSEFYILDTSQEVYEGIAMYLNFDMIASPNYMRGIYITTVDEELPIQQTFVDFFMDASLPILPLDHFYDVGGGGRSDHAYFQTYGIPAGGLFTGAEAIKTEELVELFGGTAGISLDPCYHKECDTIDNINPVVLGEMAGAAAHALYTYADMPNLNLTALALEITGPERRHKRHLVGKGKETAYMFDRLDDLWIR